MIEVGFSTGGGNLDGEGGEYPRVEVGGVVYMIKEALPPSFLWLL